MRCVVVVGSGLMAPGKAPGIAAALAAAGIETRVSGRFSGRAQPALTRATGAGAAIAHGAVEASTARRHFPAVSAAVEVSPELSRRADIRNQRDIAGRRAETPSDSKKGGS